VVHEAPAFAMPRNVGKDVYDDAWGVAVR